MEHAMSRRLTLFPCLVLLLSALVSADSGMWLFNHPPVEKIKAKYNFAPSPQWLEHVQKSSVRFNNGGSGSFVSADGLTFTNHHVAQTCLYGLSTAEKDLYKTGFYARSYAEEPRCPDLELNVLMSIEDVTKDVNAGITPAMSVSDAGAKQRANSTVIEADCNKSTGLRCQVVSFYSGAIYNLYRYKKYTDVRLVFAPEFDIAFFGGDPDNFEFPRYDLDVAFFRVYENDRPAALDDYLTWSQAGATDGELVFVSGHPGSTDRLATTAQLAFLRDLSLPYQLEVGNRRNQLLKTWSAKSPENARRAHDSIFSIENNLKRNKVYLSSLFDEKIFARKRADEAALQKALEADPKAKQEYGDPWGDIEQAMKIERDIFLPYTLIENRSAFPGNLAGYARALVRVATEKKKPNAERLREYGDSNIPSLEQTLFAKSPVYPDMEEVLLADSLAMLTEKLPADPVTTQVLGGRAPADVAHELVAGTKLTDPGVRKQLYEGGEAAIQASTDPMIVLMRTIDPAARKYRTAYDDQVGAVERIAGGKIGRLLFEKNGYDIPPDATFTLRLSYGAVRGFTENGLGHVAPKGSTVEPFTRMGGAFERADKMGNTEPFRLPKTWIDAKQAGKIKLDTPYNFVSTPDIIGGNSGSPVINRSGEVVGIIFDGNMQSLPWRYLYDDGTGRAVSVDSRGILEALQSIYGASRVVDELTARKVRPTAAGAARD
jgi:hypothetical protein